MVKNKGAYLKYDSPLYQYYLKCFCDFLCQEHYTQFGTKFLKKILKEFWMLQVPHPVRAEQFLRRLAAWVG